MPEAIITVVGLGVQLGAHRVVDGGSVTVNAGMMTAVIGPNGKALPFDPKAPQLEFPPEANTTAEIGRAHV